MTSPPARVINAFRTVGLTFLDMNLTAPSAKTALKPSGLKLPSSGTGPLGSKGMSSGLVQGISRLASTARIVFDVPSEMSMIEGWVRPEPAPGAGLDPGAEDLSVAVIPAIAPAAPASEEG